MLSRRLGIKSGIAITLHKAIPVQAGLGGGSSNAAATLAAAQWLWTRAYDHELACELAADLGSDVNFFMEGAHEGTWAASCSGRGEKVVPFHLKRDDTWLLVRPNFGCDTASVFRKLQLDGATTRKLNQAVEYFSCEQSTQTVDEVQYNRLYDAAVAAYPELGTFCDRLENIDHSLRFVMSGSGSTFASVCSYGQAVQACEKIHRTLNCFTYIGKCWKTESISEQIDDLNR